MLSAADLPSFGAPPELVDLWSADVGELTDIQEKAVRAGVLDGSTNVLAVAPTSSGKTLIGELAATTSAYTRRRHAIFIVPFRALAEEHFELFRERYGSLLSVVISTSDHPESDADIRAGNFNLAVMTYEKLIGFLVHQPDLLERCTALVVDEVQSLSDGDRGANLEVLLTQTMLVDAPPQSSCRASPSGLATSTGDAEPSSAPSGGSRMRAGCRRSACAASSAWRFTPTSASSPRSPPRSRERGPSHSRRRPRTLQIRVGSP
jgi:hypothetical protein